MWNPNRNFCSHSRDVDKLSNESLLVQESLPLDLTCVIGDHPVHAGLAVPPVDSEGDLHTGGRALHHTTFSLSRAMGSKLLVEKENCGYLLTLILPLSCELCEAHLRAFNVVQG